MFILFLWYIRTVLRGMWGYTPNILNGFPQLGGLKPIMDPPNEGMHATEIYLRIVLNEVLQ